MLTIPEGRERDRRKRRWYPFGKKAKGEHEWEAYQRALDRAEAKARKAVARAEAKVAARKRKQARDRKRRQRARARETTQ